MSAINSQSGPQIMSVTDKDISEGLNVLEGVEFFAPLQEEEEIISANSDSSETNSDSSVTQEFQIMEEENSNSRGVVIDEEFSIFNGSEARRIRILCPL